MDRYENPAIVIGGTENGLGVIRNLGRNGIDVYCLVDKKHHAVYSKYCKEYFVIPGVTSDLPRLKIVLNKFKNQLAHKAVLFPLSDVSILNVSSLVDELSDYYLITISDRNVLETLIKKKRFYHSLSKNGVPHPQTFFLDLENLGNIDEEITFPVFIKPSESQVFMRKLGRKGFVAHSKEELNRYLKLIQRNELEVMIQEIVPGPPTNHYLIDGYFDKNSNPVVLFARQRLRMFPPSFGSSTACVSIPISEISDMKETIVKYLSSLNFRGIFNAEFKVDSRDNIGKLLEVNARSWGGSSIGNTFPSACGANIILIAYLEAIGKEVEINKAYETGILGINFVLDLMSCLSTIDQRKLSFKAWLSSMKGKKHWTVWARDDMKPFLIFIRNFLGAMLAGRNWYLDHFKDILKGVSAR